MRLKRLFPLGASATCNHSKYREQRHLVANYFGVLSALYTKLILNINYIRMCREIIDDYRLSYLNDLFEIKLIILRYKSYIATF